jgi:hypothetical protein
VPNLLGAPFNQNPRLAYEGTLGNPTGPGGQGGQLWQYTKTMAVYRCPLDQTNDPNWKVRDNKLSTYVQNGAICNFNHQNSANPATFKQAQFRQDAYMMWEPGVVASNPGFGYNDASSYPDPAQDGGLGRRHGKIGGIVLNFSGSVMFIKSNAWYQAARDTGKNQLWCNPGQSNGHCCYSSTRRFRQGLNHGSGRGLCPLGGHP